VNNIYPQTDLLLKWEINNRPNWINPDLQKHCRGADTVPLSLSTGCSIAGKTQPQRSTSGSSLVRVLLPVALLSDLPHLPGVGDGFRGAWRKPSNILFYFL